MFGHDYELPWTEVKARQRTPDSLELAPALHLSEQGNHGLLHSRELLGRESVFFSPVV
jgi:hypothetical protein